jgi:hypothetical protein
VVGSGGQFASHIEGAGEVKLPKHGHGHGLVSSCHDQKGEVSFWHVPFMCLCK